MTDEQPIVVGEKKKGTDTRRVKVLLGVAALVLVGSQVVPRLVAGGGGGSDERPGPAPAASPTPSTTSTTEPAPPAGSTKNPFQARLASATSPAGGESSAPADGDAGVTDPGPTDPGSTATDPPVTGPGADGGSSAATLPPTLSTLGVRISVVEVDAPGGPVDARIRVDDTVYDAVVNGTFAGSGRLVSVDVPNRCASFVYGSHTAVRLCEGEETVL
jgi:hypothetical protein